MPWDYTKEGGKFSWKKCLTFGAVWFILIIETRDTQTSTEKGDKMTVRDIYLSTNECEALEIVDTNKTLYVGCSADIPYELLGLIVYRISHNIEALIIYV